MRVFFMTVFLLLINLQVRAQDAYLAWGFYGKTIVSYNSTTIDEGSSYTIWDCNEIGQPLLEATDSLQMINQLNLSGFKFFYVLRNSSLKSPGIDLLNPWNNDIDVFLKSTCSIDSLTDGFWFQFSKKDGQIIKECEKEILKHRRIGLMQEYYDSGYTRTNYFNSGCLKRVSIYNGVELETSYMFDSLTNKTVLEERFQGGVLKIRIDNERRVQSEFYSTGVIRSLGPIDSHGNLHGELKLFDQNGKLSATENYDHGKILN